MLFPPKELVGKIDWSNPNEPKLKEKVTKDELEKFQSFVTELQENGKVHENKNSFDGEYY